MAGRLSISQFLDPSRARFRRQDKQPRGQYWQLGQEGENPSEFIPMDNNPLIKYVAIDRLPDKPYGRPMITSGVYSAIFLLGLVQDLRRVVANQGLNRIDYSINTENLLNLITQSGDEMVGDDKKTSDFINKHIDDIKTEIAKLDIDSDYVHLDTTEVKHARSGTAESLRGSDILVRSLERHIINGVKSVPILLASNESLAETHADRQLEFYSGGVESMQKALADVLCTILPDS